MVRAKLRMELISNRKALFKTFEKRKKGQEKATHELSTLYEVDIGMIIYGPDQTEKFKEEMQKLSKRMRGAKYPTWDEKYNCLLYDQLKEIVTVLMAKIGAVKVRINSMKGSRIPVSESSLDESVGSRKCSFHAGFSSTSTAAAFGVL
ncbi:hypothetical protein CDL12_14513 [Handroanthus impetiginosus]|uniref:MADS-box domain-containing protein n=1 Tax=Handroanthus impetiginosus TaxID=429701 RepID=A0A2G9H6C7_9LAMI|nr:hypothetical protein CDL12_14513 [Handroanthus impetiginosus]